MPPSSSDTIYTAISFAPVQGFIEKSRKLRDLYGASQILSYLSTKIVHRAGSIVISPVLNDDGSGMDLIQGMPNRILVEGKFSYNDTKSAIAEGWNEIIDGCRSWIEEHPQLSQEFTFSGEGWGRAWTKWKINAWEIFWGEGVTIAEGMLALETNKLRRDWMVPNWNGESSSLSGADGIAYPNMDNQDNVGSKYNPGREREEIYQFYHALARALENTKQADEPIFLDSSERLSIPELIKRLVTHHQVAGRIDQHQSLYAKSFSEMLRMKDERKGEQGGYWTGWFMGDGDQVGQHLKGLKTAQEVQGFSSNLRTWSKDFHDDFNNELKLGRVIYAGGDDFLGVIYGTSSQPQRRGEEVIKFLVDLGERWHKKKLGVTLSLGFVWAGHSVPQRDVLQHCREAEKYAKNLGRNRVTIRILFNNGQFVQWTTPWQYIEWLKDYRDRNGKTGKDANWNHVYSDLAQLKARYAIPPKTAQETDHAIAVALALLGLYFGKDELGQDKKVELSRERKMITGSEGTKSVIEWIEGMIQVGWQLCSNS